ncbi:mechanosensitive ion channel family protein [Frankia sp. CiP1_Cm_nod2]|uniref:mechanosensitive ion channel family protein n=2 Tax=unclassified Frankia TaxID=2632575 RepID=UPI004044EF39
MVIRHAAEMSLPEADSTPAVLIVLAMAAVLGYTVALVVDRTARRAGRRSAAAADLAQRGRRPAHLTLVILALLVALNAMPEQNWTGAIVRLLGLAFIGGVSWLVAVLTFLLEDLALARYRMDVADNRHARRVRTQVILLRRITVVVITVIAVASMLMTFPSVRIAGASIVASAGIVGIFAGLAAQTSLANVFAGLQLAFTDAIRVDDVVVVEKEWGRIEEITLTYVVVHIWDDRRMILPSTYFTTVPFQNWTRREAAVLGVVELDLDWSVPVEEMRAEMHRILDATALWDGRVSVLQVTDAVGGCVRVRVLVSGSDGPTVFDLRCHVRELLVRWLRQRHPAALPRTRLEHERSGPAWDGEHDGHGKGVYGPAQRRESDPTTARVAAADPATTSTGMDLPAHPEEAHPDARLFGGSPDAAERSRAFSETGENGSRRPPS